jgi:hypothetical protein
MSDKLSMIDRFRSADFNVSHIEPRSDDCYIVYLKTWPRRAAGRVRTVPVVNRSALEWRIKGIGYQLIEYYPMGKRLIVRELI